MTTTVRFNCWMGSRLLFGSERARVVSLPFCRLRFKEDAHNKGYESQHFLNNGHPVNFIFPATHFVLLFL